MTSEANADVTCEQIDHEPAWAKRCDAKYRAELSALYHQKRERFFELADKLSKAASLFGGSAALWKVGAQDGSGAIAIFAVIVTFASALSLVFGFSDRARKHAELARGFREIISEIIAKGDHDFEMKNADGWMGQVYSLEAKEPPTLSALTVMCQNELAIAMGCPGHVCQQKTLTRWMAHFFDMPQTSAPAPVN